MLGVACKAQMKHIVEGCRAGDTQMPASNWATSILRADERGSTFQLISGTAALHSAAALCAAGKSH